MNTEQWWSELNNRIQKYNLLQHPFYVAWSAGELSRQEIAAYAADYYHHVQYFPDYLAELEGRLPEGRLQSCVRQNRLEEKGHAEIWLDFAEGMGADRAQVSQSAAPPHVQSLIDSFLSSARQETPVEALARFYVYESQVPAVAAEKGRWLKEMYNADDKTRYYFTLHKTADERHAEVWRNLIDAQLESEPALQDQTLTAAEDCAKALWSVLDGMNARRPGKNACCQN